jgi:hypothetical protein
MASSAFSNSDRRSRPEAMAIAGPLGTPLISDQCEIQAVDNWNVRSKHRLPQGNPCANPDLLHRNAITSWQSGQASPDRESKSDSRLWNGAAIGRPTSAGVSQRRALRDADGDRHRAGKARRPVAIAEFEWGEGKLEICIPRRTQTNVCQHPYSSTSIRS